MTPRYPSRAFGCLLAVLVLLGTVLYYGGPVAWVLGAVAVGCGVAAWRTGKGGG